MFYRLFILLENGKYVFAKSRRAQAEGALVGLENAGDNSPKSGQRVLYIQTPDSKNKPNINAPDKINGESNVETEKVIFVKLQDSIIFTFPSKKLKHFSDSVF